MEVAGKTGSLTGKRAPALNYNWFIGYAPADKPEIAVAVVIANEPAWRIKSHYAARRLIQIYLERRDAIRTHRDLRLAPEGLVLDARDSKTGAVLANGQKGAAKPAPLPTSAEGDSALPPVPGPVAPAAKPAP
jgi:microcystin degradation protein MlrC